MIKDTSKQMAKVAVEALKEKKGYDVKVMLSIGLPFLLR